MLTRTFQHIGQAVSRLNPAEIRRAAGRPIRVGIRASSGEDLAAIEEYLAPESLSRRKRVEALQCIIRLDDPGAPQDCDVLIFEAGMMRPPESFAIDFDEPRTMVREILEEANDLALPLARRFPPFREEACQQVVRKVCRENALFSLATALPNVVPSFIELPWALGEFASDTAFLTVNQVRMAFLLAAASDRGVGYSEQKAEIASIVAGAFGWRALAREVVGKVPFGGGLLAKAAVAYAGTWVVGRSLERYYRSGYRMSRKEKRSEYERGYERGQSVAAALMKTFQRR